MNGKFFILFASSFLVATACSPSSEPQRNPDITVEQGQTSCLQGSVDPSKVSGNSNFITGGIRVPENVTFLRAKVGDFKGFDYGTGSPQYNLCITADESAVPGNYPIDVIISNPSSLKENSTEVGYVVGVINKK